MHLQGEHPIAHFLCFSPEKQSLIWTVNLLNDAARQVVFPVLESAKEIPLHELTLPVSEAVSYTHLDVYKRKGRQHPEAQHLRLCRLPPLWLTLKEGFLSILHGTIMIQDLSLSLSRGFTLFQ